MRAILSYATAVVTAAMMVSASAAYALDNKLSVPDVTVTAPAAPVEPPYKRDPWEAYERNPYAGRYRVEEDKFAEVPCAQIRIAFSEGGKCLQAVRLHPVAGDKRPCDMAFDVVIDHTAKLSIEADILIFDPYKVNTNTHSSAPRFCYVRSYLGYDQEDFQDMNQVTSRGTHWRNLQITDMQDQWSGQQRLRSIEFSDGPRNCIAARKPGPVWHGGYIYMMHVSICRTDTAALQTEDVAYVLGSLQMRIYDPIDNLRKAHDQTTYGPATNSR